jgi:hypothetical protein
MVRSALTLAQHPGNISTYTGLDADDTTYQQYKLYHEQLGTGPQFQFVRYPTGTPRREIWNNEANQAVAEGADYVWLGSDDIIFEAHAHQTGRTREGLMVLDQLPPWDYVLTQIDQQLTARHPDRHWIVWGWDGSCGPKHATHPFLTKEWVKTLGKTMPDCCEAFDGDTFQTALAKDTNRGFYTDRIYTIHHNPKYGNAPYDAVWHNARPAQKRDYDVWRSEVGQKEYADSLKTLRSALNEGPSMGQNVAVSTPPA